MRTTSFVAHLRRTCQWASALALSSVPILGAGCSSSSDAVETPPNVVTSGACLGVRLPADQHYAASGLCVRAVAQGQGELRQLTFAPNGDLLGVRVDGAIVRYRDSNGDGIFGSVTGDTPSAAGEVVVIAQTDSKNGNNLHLDGDFLYAGSQHGVKRWAYSAEVNNLGAGDDVVIDEPSDGSHPYHTVHVYDGFVYVHSGSQSNAADPVSPDYDTNRAVLKRFPLADFVSGSPFSWASGEVVIAGLRNMVGFTRRADGKLFGVVNGLDDLMYGGVDVHADNPGDDFIAIEPGQAHGYPYCFTAAHIMNGVSPVMPGTMLATAISPQDGADDGDFVNPHDDAWCAAHATPPVTFTPAHNAPLDLTFSDSSAQALPASLQGGAFVALHGSWDSSASVGHRVLFVPVDSDGHAPQPVATSEGVSYPFVTVFGGGSQAGAQDGLWGWSSGSWGENPVRPVSVAISPVDGALYVSSDNGSVGSGSSKRQGVIYRIRSGVD